MEEIYKDVLKHISVDFENDEVQDISNGLGKLIEQFVAQMTADFPYFEVERVTRCGSMAEGTRIKDKRGLEYDYILQMKTWPNRGELHFRGSCEGSMQPLYMVSEKQHVCMKTNVLKAFRENLCESIEKRCKESFCPGSDSSIYNNVPILGSGYNIAEGCKNCSIYMKTGGLIKSFEKVIYKYKFRWLPNCPRKFDIIHNPFNIKHYDFSEIREISVDIHPVLIVSPERMLENSSKPEEYSLIPGVNYFLFPCFAENPGHHPSDCKDGRACWRISHYDTEGNMLQRTSQVHRDMFMILKFVCQIMFSRETKKNMYISSYEVKTVVLHHIKNCKLSEPAIGQCLLHPLRILSKYFKEENLPNAVSAFNIFNSKNVNDARNSWFTTIGHICHALAELLDTCLHSDTAGYLKDLKLIQNEVFSALWRTQTPKPTHTTRKQDLRFLTDFQEQACKEALDRYVEQRKTRTTDSLLNELAWKQFRAERIENLWRHDLTRVTPYDRYAYDEWLNNHCVSIHNELRQEIELKRETKQRLPFGCII